MGLYSLHLTFSFQSVSVSQAGDRTNVRKWKSLTIRAEEEIVFLGDFLVCSHVHLECRSSTRNQINLQESLSPIERYIERVKNTLAFSNAVGAKNVVARLSVEDIVHFFSADSLLAQHEKGCGKKCCKLVFRYRE